MPVEDYEDEGLAKIPNLKLGQYLFTLQRNSSNDSEKNEAKSELMKAITADDMSPYYKYVCSELQWTLDDDMLKKMATSNASKLEKLEEAVKDATENLGEIEIRDAMLAKSEYLCVIGDKDNALQYLRQTYEKTTTLGHKLDNVFLQIRIGFFFSDNDIVKRNIEKAKSLIEEGGDWDRRNRLKVYQGYYAMMVRDFKMAATNFLDSISTFTSYELMDYQSFVSYAVLVSIIALERNELKKKVVKGSEILEVLHQLPLINKFLTSLYYCHYAEFFKALALVEDHLKADRALATHCQFYVREMRIMAYTQLLESYQSLTLSYMADTFGVSTHFIDRELSRFIAAGRLNCKIDKVGGIVETNRPDCKNYQYQGIIKHGDNLLNRIQKLSRVINL